MKVAVGSKNPVKIEATRRAFEKVFGECEVVGVEVSSGVSDMPIGLKEITNGAKNRAQKALKKLKADYGVGLEAGFGKTYLGTFMDGIVTVVDRQGIWGIARRGSMLMPEKIVKKVNQEKELGTVMDELLGRENIKQQEGTLGYLTKNIINRTKEFEDATVMALARFMRPEMYEE